MDKSKNYKILSLLFLISFILPFTVLALPSKIAIENNLECLINDPIEIKVTVLNDKGKRDKTFSGNKNIKVEAKEIDGGQDDSFSVVKDIISFKNGVGNLLVKNQEEESVELLLSVEGIELATSGKLIFKKDTTAPRVDSIMVEKANLIIIKFSEEIEEESGLRTQSYRAVTNKREINPDSIEFHKDYVVLKFGQHFDKDEEGYIELDGIRDLNANEISSTRSPTFKGDCGCDD